MRRVTTCPFCNLGCWVGGEVKDEGLRSVEYYHNSPYEGKLCPRGNAASLLFNHPKRMSQPIYKGEKIPWEELIPILRNKIKKYKPMEIGIVYDNFQTREEISAIYGLAHNLNTKGVFHIFPQPEIFFSYIDKKPSSFEELKKLEGAFIIGDPFISTPVVASPIFKAMKSNKNFKLAVLDVMNTSTMRFAHLPIIVPPGQQSLFLYGLLITSGDIKKPFIKESDITEILKLSRGILTELVKLLKRKDIGMIYNPSFGRSQDPLLDALLVSLVSEKFNLKLFTLGKRPPEITATPASELVAKIKKGEIKILLSFAPSFPWAYPQLIPLLKKLRFAMHGEYWSVNAGKVATVLLPLSTPLEKDGTISTFYEERKLRSLGRKDGVKSEGEIARLLGGKEIEIKRVSHLLPFDIVEERLRKVLEKNKVKREYDFVMIGEEPSFGFYELYGKEDKIKLHPYDAATLKLKPGELVKVETSQDSATLKLTPSIDVPRRMVVVNTNHIESRKLFPIHIDEYTKEYMGVITWAKLKKGS